MTKAKKIISICTICVIIPLLTFVGAVLLKGKNYNIISIVIAILALIPFFAGYERSTPKLKEMVVIAIMIALSVAGRCIFAFIPGFKPVTAVVIIAGIFLGKEAGFLTGALSALLSNLLFGQGPWTPFQMLVWGLIGFFCGICGRKIFKWWWLAIVGAIAGIAFSAVMDVWTTLNFSEGWSWTRYGATTIASLPWTAIYIASNIVFLLVLASPIGKRLERLKMKYGIFETSTERKKREKIDADERKGSQEKTFEGLIGVEKSDRNIIVKDTEIENIKLVRTQKKKLRELEKRNNQENAEKYFELLSKIKKDM